MPGLRLLRRALMMFCCGSLFAVVPGMRGQAPVVPVYEKPPAYTGTPVPLLSVQSVHYLVGTWSAMSRDGLTSLGTYSFVPELNGHVLARKSVVDPSCNSAKQPVCARRDVFYIYQESEGAPLQAISFDDEGHVIRYFITLSSEASTSTLGQRDFVVFDSDPTQLGPRVRLRYEHNVDSQTGKDILNGAFEVLQPDGRYLITQQWYGTRQ